MCGPGLEILYTPCWFAQKIRSFRSGDHTLSSKALKHFDEEAQDRPFPISSREKHSLLNIQAILGRASEAIATSFQVRAASEGTASPQSSEGGRAEKVQESKAEQKVLEGGSRSTGLAELRIRTALCPFWVLRGGGGGLSCAFSSPRRPPAFRGPRLRPHHQS